MLRISVHPFSSLFVPLSVLQCNLGPILWHRSTKIGIWICNYIRGFIWYVISHPCIVLQDAPEFASTVGEHQYDDQLESASEGAQQARFFRGRYLLTQLEDVDREALTPKQQRSYDLLYSQVHGMAKGFKWRCVNRNRLLSQSNMDNNQLIKLTTITNVSIHFAEIWRRNIC